MQASSILVSWIGHADLSAMAEDLGEPLGPQLLAAAKIDGKKYGEKPGPLKTALNQALFTEIHLLSNYPAVVHKPFVKWLGGQPTIHKVELPNPTDYSQVFEVADQVLAGISKRLVKDKSRLCFLLSPGTPAMAAIWVLLGKSRYPATFFQTHKGTLWETDIPFDLAVDYVPQLLRDPDANLQHLAANAPREIDGFQQIVGESKAIRLAVGRARKAALRDVPILILGESGTGKEMFARAIHAASHRKNGSFVAVNCAAIPRDLLEAELFGYKKGAFTGAQSDRPGAFDRADSGTLFLDELGDCDLAMQTKLLRVLQPPPGKGPCHREFSPVGATEPALADVRVIAATHADLLGAIQEQRFREDLYYRVAVITLKLPPLRERRSDIPLLAEALLQQINQDFRAQEPGYRDKSISAIAMEFVKRHHWPGNIRQLYNALLQAAVMAEGEILERRDLVDALAEIPGGPAVNLLEHPLGDGFNLEEHLNAIQRHFLDRAMTEAAGVKTRAARLLGMKNYQTLDAQLKRLQVKGWS